jgi:predicted amidohydrolase YtcJ
MNVKRIRGKVLIGLGLVAAIAVAAISANPQSVNQQVAAANAPDLILYNGKISTLDAESSVVKAIAIRDGVIIATDDQSGRIRALAGKDTDVVNLNGRRVLPGLIDGHLHGMREGYHCWTQVVRLDLVTSRAQALAMYAAKAAEIADGRWIWTTAGGWNVNQLDVPQIFTFAELTAAAPANPLWINGSGFAGPRVNQAALDALGLAPGSPGVVLDAGGQPTGQLVAPATTLANQAILAQLDALGVDGEGQCLSDFIEEANSRGLTAWKDAGGNDAPWGTGGAISFSAVRNGATGPRYRTVMESGAHMCLATDAMNVAPWAPFQSLWYVTTGDTLLPRRAGVPADQQLTREEALRHATVECAWFLDLDGKPGTLEPGMLADLIVLSDDYFTVPDDEVKDLKSLLTVVDGRIVYADGPYAGLD